MRRQEALEAGDVAMPGCREEGVEKTFVLGRTCGHPSAISDVLACASHHLPRVGHYYFMPVFLQLPAHPRRVAPTSIAIRQHGICANICAIPFFVVAQAPS